MPQSHTVLVDVPKPLALEAGSSRFGRFELPLTDELLAKLCAPERLALGAFVGEAGRSPGELALTLDAADPSPETIAAALRRELAEQAKRAAEQAEAEVEAEARRAAVWAVVASALDAGATVQTLRTDPRRFAPSFTDAIGDMPERPRLTFATVGYEEQGYAVDASILRPLAELGARHGATDAQLLELRRLEAACLEAARARVALGVERREAAARAEHEAKKAQQERIAAYDAAIRAYAVEHMPELARAAVEGYDLGSSVLRAIATEIAKNFPGAEVLMWEKGDRGRYDTSEVERRKAPRTAAFERLDEVKFRVKDADIPSSIDVDEEGIWRIRFFRDDPELREFEPWRTACIVLLTPPEGATAVIVIPAE